jgi:hypothetical protein
MKRLAQRAPHWAAAAALASLLLLALPGARQWLESSMSAHMLAQFPLLGLCGFLLAGALPRRWRERLGAWNAYGISGLFATAVALAILMIPRVLDLALVDRRVELAKWLALLLCGAAVRISWRPAGLLVQGFFLGNVLPMMAVAGQLFEDSPIRLCNAYLLDDQARLGRMLTGIAVALALAWLARLALATIRREAAANLPAGGGAVTARPESP